MKKSNKQNISYHKNNNLPSANSDLIPNHKNKNTNQKSKSRMTRIHVSRGHVDVIFS